MNDYIDLLDKPHPRRNRRRVKAKIARAVCVIGLLAMFFFTGAADIGTWPFLRCYALAFASLIVAVIAGYKGGIMR